MSLSKEILNKLHEDEDFEFSSQEEYEKWLETPDENGISLSIDPENPTGSSFKVHHAYEDMSTDEELEDFFIDALKRSLKNITIEDIKDGIQEVSFKDKTVKYKGGKYTFDKELGVFEDEKGNVY